MTLFLKNLYLPVVSILIFNYYLVQKMYFEFLMKTSILKWFYLKNIEYIIYYHN